MNTIIRVLRDAALLTAIGVATAAAQDFPQRPITLVVGFGAGGGTDTNARIFADKLSQNIGQSVVVENRTGAGGGIAAASVQKAKPDGYTLLVMSGLQHAYVPASQPKPMYEPVKGFAPVSLFFEMISVMATPIEHPAKSAGDLIKLGKTKAEGLSLGSPGVGSPPHLFGALMQDKTGMKVEVVQYRGSTPIMTDLVAGRIDVGFPTFGLAKGFMADNKIRPLAIAASERWKELPDLPTLTEAGLVEQMPAMWFGVIAPAGTPEPVIKRLNDEFKKVAQDPDVIKKLNATGMAVRTSTPEEMKDLMVAESKRIGELVERLDLKMK